MTGDGAAGDGGQSTRDENRRSGEDPGSRSRFRFPEPVARRGRTSPESTAVVDAATGEEWTYADLDRAVDATASRLADLGIAPGDHLGTLAGTRVATVRLVHAAARLGAVLVPLNARHTPGEVAHGIDRADLTALVCTADTEGDALAAVDAADASPPVASLDAPATDGVRRIGSDDSRPSSDPPGGDDRSVDPYRWSPADSQAILFTSGTTGDPKAVVVTAGNLLASAVGSAFRLGVLPGDRWLCELPAYHMGGIAPFYRSALYGTTVVVQEREDGFDASRTVENLREYAATGISLVPTQLDRMLEVADGRLSESLRFVLLGGGPAPEDLVVRATDRDVPVHPTYGTTETASQIATARPDEAAADPTTVGRPLAVTDLTVVDDDGRPLPAGEVGEIVVDGPTVTPRYYDDAAATEAAFGDHGLHTGDEGYVDEAGRAYVRGRRTDRIVTGGENVSPAEVRAALCDQDGVEDAAVVGVDDPEWGQRVAALVVRRDTGLDEADLLAGLSGRLADYKHPRTVAFADELPRTASGTVDRAATKSRIEAEGDGSTPDG